MNFDRNGIPGLMPGYDYVESFLKLSFPIEYNDSGWEQARGKYKVSERSYAFTIAKDANVEEVQLVELLGIEDADTFEGIYMNEISVRDFMHELSKVGSNPVLRRDSVLWLKERMSFYIFEDTARTIGWWSKDAERFLS